jgi:hypothetical protein
MAAATAVSKVAATSEGAAMTPEGFEIRFKSLFLEGRAMSFPCDARGKVDLDSLSVRGQHNYLFARRMIGREYAVPVVVASHHAGSLAIESTAQSH